MSHSVFTQKKVTIFLQSFKGIQYLQKVDNESDCVINRSSVNHSTRLNIYQSDNFLSVLDWEKESEDSSSASSRLRQNIYSRLRNLSWGTLCSCCCCFISSETKLNPDSWVTNLTVMRKLNLNPLIRMISRYKICDYGMIKSPYLVFY